jgi:hypothetical protein
LAACAPRAPARPAGETVSVELVAVAAPAGVRALTALRAARDVAGAGERIAVATAGGVVEYEGDRFARTLTWATGLAAVEATAVCALPDGQVAVGGADGSVTIGGRALWLGGGAVSDLAFDGSALLVATHAGLYAWVPGAPTAERLVAGEEVTSVVAGEAGVALGTASGQVLGLGRDGLRPLATGDRVTALAWDGAALWIGRPGALERLDPDGRVERVRRGLAVTALLLGDGVLLAGTSDEGVLALDQMGAERRLLGAAEVARLRRVAGRPVAVADGAVFSLPDGARLVPAPPPGLGAAPVAALVLARETLWVGTPVGADVFDSKGNFVRHAAGRAPVYGLAARPELGEVVAGTAQGALHVGAAGERPVGAREGLLGLRVQASAWLVDTGAFATEQGVTVIDGRGVARQLPVGAAAAVAWGDGGRLYAGTASGLLVVEGPAPPRQLLEGPIAALALGADGMYAAGASGLVLVAPSGTVERLGGDAVNVGALAVEATPAGERVYAGSPSRGLLVYEHGARAWHAVRALVPSGNVTAVAPATDGLWLGTDAGLVHVARDALERALAPARS